MTTIYEEARNRLEGEICTLELRLDMSKGLATPNMLSSQLRNYKEMIATLEQDFRSTDPTLRDLQDILRKEYDKGKELDDGFVHYYSVHVQVYG